MTDDDRRSKCAKVVNMPTRRPTSSIVTYGGVYESDYGRMTVRSWCGTVLDVLPVGRLAVLGLASSGDGSDRQHDDATPHPRRNSVSPAAPVPVHLQHTWFVLSTCSTTVPLNLQHVWLVLTTLVDLQHTWPVPVHLQHTWPVPVHLQHT